MKPEYPKIASREQWLAARVALLEQEKALTRQRDALNAARRQLPMVEVTADYRFNGPDGEVPLAELFEGRRQLIVYHFMYHRDKGEGCPGCSFLVDNIGHQAHLHARDTNLVLVSRAPLAELEAFRRRMGWRLPWYSSFGSRFNYDFHVTLDAAEAPVEYNYRDRAELQRQGQLDDVKGELPGASVFLRDGERVYHCYSTYARGLDMLMNTYHYLDLTPFGRGEGWGGMPDLEGKGLMWTRLHDEYQGAAPARHDCCA
ncbi:DUF899 domain-containing protein [Pseudomonas sp. L-22-4S-12]|uniref:DUF899 domain-containing protein n=1 Tax=Pseudomonas sp. L-22-4S-12 TaxID=2610893 RepID=UPI0013297F31|nr:DUF899 domain-containing protein [Pseudomonas sp. L-22-4S-12]MWV15524.1 DUF899 domain-containing protein [Pseudomonas sp. L-22-4S-12]